MPIQVRCPCGGETQVAERFAGHRVACPACKRPILVPLPDGVLTLSPPEPPPSPPRAEPRPRVLPSTRKKGWEGPMPFPLLVLGVLLRPFKTLEFAGAWLASPTNLALAFGLFVGSVGAQAYLGSLQLEALRRSSREPTTSQKLAAKPLPVGQAVVAAIVASSLIVLFHASVVDFVGRIMSGGGQFLLLLAALALVYGVMNLVDFGLVLSLSRGNQWQAAVLARYGVLFWSVILGIVTVMKVYDFDFKTALATCFLAWALRSVALFFLARALASFR